MTTTLTNTQTPPLTDCEWRVIRGVDGDEMMRFIRDGAHAQEQAFLASDYDDLTIGGRNVSDWLCNVYFLACKDATNKAVLSFLCALDNSDALQKLSTGIFIKAAAAQHKKTEFKALIDCELRRRRRLEKLRREEEAEADRAEYYGERLCQSVVEQILSENDLQVRLNTATKKMEVSGNGSRFLYETYSRDNILTTLPVLIADICRKNRVNAQGGVSAAAVSSYLFNIADANRYNPIREMLVEHCNTNGEHLERIYGILGLKSSYEKTLVRKWMIQTVAFAFATSEQPVSAEGVLVLQGRQGNGKTSFFRVLSGKPEWFSEGAVIDMRNKDSVIAAVSSWICELGEIDSTLKKEQSALKAFITRGIDRIRLPYAPVESEIPRTTSLCGTVNPEQFLKDATGNRRYWTIHVDNIDKQALFALTQDDVFDLWGYIYNLYSQDHGAFRLDDKENIWLNANNLEYAAGLPFEDEVRELLDFLQPEENWRWVRPTQLAVFLGKGARAEHVGWVLKRVEEEERAVKKRRATYGVEYLLPVNRAVLSNEAVFQLQ